MTVIHNSRHIVIPPLLGVRVHTPRSAAAASWWVVAGKTCVAAYQPKGAASLAASYVNLANPGTYNAAPGVAPTLDATGWVFNGSTQYLDSGVVPATAYSVLSCFTMTGGVAARGLFAQRKTSNILNMIWESGWYAQRGAQTKSLGADSGGKTTFAMAGRAVYKDGSSVHTFTADFSTDLSLYIAAANVDGVALFCFGGSIHAMAIYSDTLTSDEVSTVSAAMAAL